MRRASGVTLIEVLIAIIIMVIGLVGILALFPAALKVGKESMEETQAAITAESVKHALTIALKNANWVEGSGIYKVVMTHDLQSGGNTGQYTMILPKLSQGWVHFPSGLSAMEDAGIPTPMTTNPNDQPQPVFKLGKDPWVYAAGKEVQEKSDMSDPYAQFAFSFDVKKINTLAYLTPPPPDLEKRTTLYEFEINVFREKPNAQQVGGDTTVVAPSTAVPYALITTLRAKITVR